MLPWQVAMFSSEPESPSAPTLRSGSPAYQEGAGDITVTLPTHQSGDVLYIFMFTEGNTGTVATPSGWTKILAETGSLFKIAAFRKVATSSSETNPLMDWTGNSQTSAISFSVVGADNSTPEDVSPSTGSGSGTTTADSPDITTTAENTLVIVAYGVNSPNFTTEDTGYPSGFTGMFNREHDSGGSGGGVAYKTQASAGSIGGPHTWTWGNGSATDNWTGVSWAIKPA